MAGNQDEKPKRYDKLKDGEIRKTFIVKEELADKFNSIAYWERTTIKEVISEAMQDYINKYEKTHGPIKVPGKPK